jgi:two-component system, NarL family, sensor kinase
MKFTTPSVIVVILVFINLVLLSNPTTDSLKSVLEKSSRELKVDILCELCWEYRFISGDTAIDYGNIALDLAKDINYLKGVAQSYNDLGIIYLDRGSYGDALNLFNESMKIRQNLKDSIGIASLYNKIGIIYQKQGRLKDALTNAFHALEIYEVLNHELWIGYCLNNIAIINFNIGDLSTSLEYHQKALEYRIKRNDSYGVAGSYGNIANVYLALNDTIKAIVNYNLALDIARDINQPESIATLLTNLGVVYLSSNENLKAVEFLSESLKIREKQGDRKGIASTLLKLGSSNMNLGHHKMAGIYYFRGLEIAKSIGVIEEEMQAYLDISRWYANDNIMDSAFIYRDFYTTIKDSVYEQRLNQQIIDVHGKYEAEKREKDLMLLQKEKLLADISLRQSKTEVLLLTIIILTIIGSAIFIFYQRKQKQKLALDMEIIRHNEQQIQAVLEGQEQERRKIARELHDGVGQSLSGVKLKWGSISQTIVSDTLKEKLNVLSDLIDSAAYDVRNISHQMMPKELEQFGLVSAIEGIIAISEESMDLTYNFNMFNMEERLFEDIELGLFRIIQELFNNIHKHAEADEVNINLLKKQKHIVLIVEDNGCGFDYVKQCGIGIGLMNIESRVQGLKGKLNYESNRDSGTIVTIRIPYD